MIASEWVELGTLALGVVSATIMPFVLRGLSRQDVDRATFKTEMHDRLNHIDDCVDDLKGRVLGEMVSRAEVAANEARVIETLNRMRAAISGDTKGLHDRIMRLENWRLDRRES